jgi:Mg-chelatase subunit ChlD
VQEKEKFKTESEMEFVNIDAVSSELKCSICLLPWSDPLQTPCEHIFCGKCLLPHVQGAKACPDCRQPIPNTKLLGKPARPLLSMSNRVEVYCPNKKRGCEWTGERGNVNGHLSSCLNHPPPEECDEGTTSATTAVLLQTINEFPVVDADKEQKILTMAHIVAPTKVAEEKRKPVAVSAVIDISGSMSGGKLDLVKETMRFVVEELSAEDELGIVAFDDTVEERLTLSRMDQVGKERALSAIAALFHRGSTNLSGGLFAGMAQIRGLPVAPTPTVPTPIAAPNIISPKPRTSSLRQAMNTILNPFTSSKHKDPTPASVFPAGTTLEAELTISHDYTPFKRDSKTIHRYIVTVLVAGVPSHGIKSITVRGSPLTGTNLVIESPTVVPDADVVVTFIDELKPTTFTVKYPLGTEEDGKKTQKHTLSNSSATVAEKEKKLEASSERICVNAVWLFTDGEANVGIQDPTELIAATKKELASHPKDLTIFTFGFGSGHNANLLQGIAETSQGGYYYIQNQGTIKESFADCLGGLLSVVAQNIKLEAIFGDGITLDRLMTKFPTTTTASGSVEVVMKDLYSDEERDILISLNVPKFAAAKGIRILRWRMSYLNLLTGAIEVVEIPVTVEFGTAAADQKPDDQLDKQRNRIIVTDAMEEAKKQAEAGNLEMAKMHLQRCSSAVGATTTAADSYTVGLQRDLFTAQECMLSASHYQNVGSKAMSKMHSCHSAQRCNDVSEDAMYETKAKKSAKSKAKGFFS